MLMSALSIHSWNIDFKSSHPIQNIVCIFMSEVRTGGSFFDKEQNVRVTKLLLWSLEYSRQFPKCGPMSTLKLMTSYGKQAKYIPSSLIF